MTGLATSLLFYFPPLLAFAGSFELRRVQTPLHYVEYEFAVETDARGVPRMNWETFRARPRNLVTRDIEAVVLENAHFRATILPSMGRLHSFVHKPSGREQLWINPAAIPIGAHNDTGFWVTWGGIEYVMPRGEHGTSHALRWEWSIEEDSAGRKAVRAWVVEPLTGLEHSLTFVASPDRSYLETIINIRNSGRESRRFSHWTTAVLAPGGAGEVTPRTEFIVPAERFVPADKPFNKWMTPLLGDTRTSALRFAASWKDMGDLMSTPFRKPFYAAYSHERDEAVVRVLDLAHTPGFNIWMWGFPPGEKRQRQYTAKPPNVGYAEFWNGTVKDYADESLGVIEPGARLEWSEKLCAVSGLRGAADLVRALDSACSR